MNSSFFLLAIARVPNVTLSSYVNKPTISTSGQIPKKNTNDLLAFLTLYLNDSGRKPIIEKQLFNLLYSWNLHNKISNNTVKVSPQCLFESLPNKAISYIKLKNFTIATKKPVLRRVSAAYASRKGFKSIIKDIISKNNKSVNLSLAHRLKKEFRLLNKSSNEQKLNMEVNRDLLHSEAFELIPIHWENPLSTIETMDLPTINTEV